MNEEVTTNTGLSVSPGINTLAIEVLSKDNYNFAQGIFSDILSEDYSKNTKAIYYLTTLVPSKPKRPLYYVNYQLRQGRRMQTRMVVSYLGAFMEMNMTQLSKKVGGFKNYLPFGGTLFKLKGKIPNNLYLNLDKYNKIFYRQAKHYYENYGRDEHLFSLKDAIFCCFITMALYKKIIDKFDIRYVEPSSKFYLSI